MLDGVLISSFPLSPPRALSVFQTDPEQSSVVGDPQTTAAPSFLHRHTSHPTTPLDQPATRQTNQTKQNHQQSPPRMQANLHGFKLLAALAWAEAAARAEAEQKAWVVATQLGVGRHRAPTSSDEPCRSVLPEPLDSCISVSPSSADRKLCRSSNLPTRTPRTSPRDVCPRRLRHRPVSHRRLVSHLLRFHQRRC